jgi:acetyltransferase
MQSCSKPIYPVLPSIINVKEEIDYFIGKGHINFPDEVELGRALARAYHTPAPADESGDIPEVDREAVRKVVDAAAEGYLTPEAVAELLDLAGIPRAGEKSARSKEEAVKAAGALGYPVVMKVIGPVHKSDVGGVVVDVSSEKQVRSEFDRIIQIEDAEGVLIQPMLSGTELFAGMKSEPGYGHLILCGLGGVFVEILKDVQSGLAPLSRKEALEMIQGLSGYGMIAGARGQEGVDEERFADVLVRLSALALHAPEIAEMDLNPLLGTTQHVTAVDARIRIERETGQAE